MRIEINMKSGSTINVECDNVQIERSISGIETIELENITGGDYPIYVDVKAVESVVRVG